MFDSTTEFKMHPVTSDEIDKRSDTFFEMDQRKNEFLATLAHELRKGFGLVFARSICVLLSLQARTIEWLHCKFVA